MKKFTKVITIVLVMLLGIFGLVACSSDEPQQEEKLPEKWSSMVTSHSYTISQREEFGNLKTDVWKGGEGKINNTDLELSSGSMVNDQWISGPYGYFEIRFKNVGEGKFSFVVEQGDMRFEATAEGESINVSIAGADSQAVDISKYSDVPLANQWHSIGFEWCDQYTAHIDDKDVVKPASIVVYVDAKKVCEVATAQLVGGEGKGSISISLDDKSNTANKVIVDYVGMYSLDKDGAQ